jgi:uncharacterized membrane protein
LGSSNLANGLTAGEAIGMVFVGSILADLIAFVCGEPGVRSSLHFQCRQFVQQFLIWVIGSISLRISNDEQSIFWDVWLIFRRNAQMLRQLHLVSIVANID